VCCGEGSYLRRAGKRTKYAGLKILARNFANRTFATSRLGLEDNIKMDLK
jgi:hypothetical protein